MVALELARPSQKNISSVAAAPFVSYSPETDVQKPTINVYSSG
jgi:hypothetical protein